MGLFDFVKKQFASVVEWPDMDDSTIFYKWSGSELKKGSRLILRPGQDAVFFYQGKCEGIFTEEGDYDIQSQIIPFLSTLAGFKFGFDTGLRAEIMFVNTREFTVNWGTKNAINLPMAGLPGGMPIRAFGSFICKVGDYTLLYEKVAGVSSRYTIDDIRQRIDSIHDSLLMKWITKEGKDMFNIQANGYDISAGIADDLNAEFERFGMCVTNHMIQNVSYPDNVREMQEKAAGAAMVGDVTHYTQVQMANSMTEGNGGSAAATAAQMAMGMSMGQQMVNNMNAQNAQNAAPAASSVPNFCPNCGAATNGANFCPNCGQKLV